MARGNVSWTAFNTILTLAVIVVAGALTWIKIDMGDIKGDLRTHTSELAALHEQAALTNDHLATISSTLSETNKRLETIIQNTAHK